MKTSSKQICLARVRDMQQHQNHHQYECCICLEPLTSNSQQPITNLQCGHQLHTSCLMQLIDKQYTSHNPTSTSTLNCPLCRSEIFTFSNRQQQHQIQSLANQLPPPQQQVIFINDDILLVDREQIQITHRKQIIALLGTLSAGALFFMLMAYDAFFKNT